MKVAYSCSEDIQILKLHGCYTKNIYDLQIAAKMGDYPALSYADLLLAEMNIELDKSLQRSDWRRRPLSKKQLQYASQDVVPLLRLHEIVHHKVLANGTAKFLAEDNKECEEITVSEYTVKLSGKQKKTYDSLTQRKLYALMIQRDEIARQYNIPPANVSGDRILEEFINNPKKGFPEKGLASRLREDEASIQKMESVLALKEIDLPQIPRELKESYGHRNADSYATPLSEADLSKIKDEVANQYGQVASDHILRGFKKFLTSSVGLQGLRPYQQEVVKAAAGKYDIKVR
jgi:ribonuclease D